ncbi:MAG: SH3 domain-containing protein, partial [Firmicutes bacterium]|nr:SH3 domain-containing protein [Bacillota bacterium]
EHWYRIRKSWEDKSSQVGAYKSLALAKKNCPDGYAVYDWNGEKVYPEEATVDYAASFDKAKAGTYTVRSDDGLNLRTGAGVENTLIENMADGSTVRCYGYYTGKWLLVVSASGKTGFCYGGYLEKQ